MSYQGMMDGWHGDEMECQHRNGACAQCDCIYDEQSDYEYELNRDEEAA